MTTIEDNCLKIMEQLLKNGFSYQVPRQELENAIIFCEIGLDERTFKRWIRALQVHDYIKQVSRQVYEMNVAKVPNLFKILKNLPQTHLSALSPSPSLSQTTREKEP